jgi:hypothetical protein
MKAKLPKAINVPPSLNAADIGKAGSKVTIKEARVVKDQWTTIGTTKLGLALTVEHKGSVYSQLFSCDKEILAGSIGRILTSMGVEDVNEQVLEQVAKNIVGKTFAVQLKDGKVYWYP